MLTMTKPVENMHFPMAISAITSPPNDNTAGEDLSSPTNSFSSLSSSSIISESSQLCGPLVSDFKVDNRKKPQSLPPSSSLSSSSNLQRGRYHPYLDNVNTNVSSSLTSSPPFSQQSPEATLSLQERRQRNKAASAKYRAKKNQQHGQMRSTIGSLTRDNELLQRQLEHVRQENNQLKATCDQLRGKMMAEKMLKRMMLEDKYDVQKLRANNFDLVENDDEEGEDMAM